MCCDGAVQGAPHGSAERGEGLGPRSPRSSHAPFDATRREPAVHDELMRERLRDPGGYAGQHRLPILGTNEDSIVVRQQVDERRCRQRRLSRYRNDQYVRLFDSTPAGAAGARSASAFLASPTVRPDHQTKSRTVAGPVADR